jgi:hypothetical protein
MGRMVAWESLLELAAIHLLEFSRGVLSYREQPVLIQYADGELIRDYYPDFEVVLFDGVAIHLEVKTTYQLTKPKIQSKFQAIAAHYQRRQQGFRLVTEKELQREPLLGNVRTLAYLVGKTKQALLSPQELLNLLGAEIVAFDFAESCIGRDALLRLLAYGVLDCDLNQPLSGETLVQIVKGGDHATYLI